MSQHHVRQRRTHRGPLAGFALLAILAVSLLAYGGRDDNAVAAATPGTSSVKASTANWNFDEGTC